MKRVEMKVRVVAITESGIMVADEKGEYYNWFTRSYTSPLFYAVGNEWFLISASTYVYDHPTPKTGLKNVRVLKGEN